MWPEVIYRFVQVVRGPRILVHLRNCSREVQLIHATTVTFRIVPGREAVVALVGITNPGSGGYLVCVI